MRPFWLQGSPVGIVSWEPAMLVSEPVFSSKLQRLSCHRKQPVGIFIWQATDDQCGWKAFWRPGQDSVCTYVQYKYVPEQFRRQTYQHSTFTHTYMQFIFHQRSVKTKCHLLFSHVLQKFKKKKKVRKIGSSSEEQIRKWKKRVSYF